MALNLTIEAKARIFRLFDLSQLLNASDLDLTELDLNAHEDIARLYEFITEFIETGEVGAYDDMLFHLHGFDPETCTITANEEHELDIDALTLLNQPVGALIRDAKDLEIGDVLLATLDTGDARWDFTADIDSASPSSEKLALGYYDCNAEADQYDVMGNTLFSYLCDTFSTDQISYDAQKVELEDFLFHPEQVFGQIFVVKEVVGTGEKILERIDPESAPLQDAAWQLLVNAYTDE
jgi:hypothetical protein